MTYAEFLALFVVIPLALALSLFHRELDRAGVKALLVLSAIVYVATSVWDNAAVAMGLWGFAPSQNLGLTIGYLPLEEYLFFGLQTWLVGLVDLGALADGSAMKTAYLFHLCVYSLPILAILIVLLGRRFRAQSWAVLRAIALPIVAVAAWLTVVDNVAIARGIWFFGAGKHLGVYLGHVPIEEALFFVITNSLIGVALALFLPRSEIAL